MVFKSYAMRVYVRGKYGDLKIMGVESRDTLLRNLALEPL